MSDSTKQKEPVPQPGSEAEVKSGDTCPVPTMTSTHMPDFASGPIFRPILRMGWPSIIGFLAVNIYDVVDLFWIAKLGAGHVAAIALFEGFYWVLIASNDIAGLGSVAVISRRYGENNMAAAATAIKETFILKLVCALFSGILGLIFLEDLMRLMGAKGEVVDLGVQYGRIHMFAMGFFFCAYSVFTSLRSIEAPKRAMALMLFGSILNMILDPLLIFGIGPFPELGIAGAAWASAIAYTITLGIGLYMFFAGGRDYSACRHLWCSRRGGLRCDYARNAAGNPGHFWTRSGSIPADWKYARRRNEGSALEDGISIDPVCRRHHYCDHAGHVHLRTADPGILL
jgi:hypothetical protein